jgi:hypothetical protein
MIIVEPKFNKGDYIINHSSKDMAIVKGVTKKGYYQFETYYSGMSKQLKDLKNMTFELQVNYQKFFELCNDEEKEKLNEIIKKESK